MTMRQAVWRGAIVGIILGLAVAVTMSAHPRSAEARPPEPAREMGIISRDGYDIKLIDTANSVICYGANNYSNLACVHVPSGVPTIHLQVMPSSPSEDSASVSSGPSNESNATVAWSLTAQSTTDSDGLAPHRLRRSGPCPTKPGRSCRTGGRLSDGAKPPTL